MIMRHMDHQKYIVHGLFISHTFGLRSQSAATIAHTFQPGGGNNIGLWRELA